MYGNEVIGANDKATPERMRELMLSHYALHLPPKAAILRSDEKWRDFFENFFV